jgi:hypothetical protein
MQQCDHSACCGQLLVGDASAWVHVQGNPPRQLAHKQQMPLDAVHAGIPLLLIAFILSATDWLITAAAAVPMCLTLLQPLPLPLREACRTLLS